MKTHIKIFVSILFSFVMSLSYSQNFYPADKKYEKPGREYKKNTRNRDISIRAAGTYEAPMKIRAERDYFISVVGRYSSDIQFRILEAETGKELYNNALGEFASAVEFRCPTDTEIIIEISPVYNTATREQVNLLYAYK